MTIGLLMAALVTTTVAANTPFANATQSKTLAPTASSQLPSKTATGWRARRPATYQMVQGSGATVAQASVLVPASNVGQVRQAATLASADPFKNPFGDGQPASRRGSVTHVSQMPTESGFGSGSPNLDWKPGITGPATPAVAPTTPPAAPAMTAPETTAPGWIESTNPGPAVAPPKAAVPVPPKSPVGVDPNMPPGISDVGPDTEAGELDVLDNKEASEFWAKARKSCRRYYMERNFCQEAKECHDVATELRDKKINEIDLNIAPPFAPDVKDPAKVAEIRRSKLGVHANRKWYQVNNTPFKDRYGNDLEGSFQKMEGTTVFVKHLTDGSVLQIPFAQLSLDDKYFIKGRPWRNKEGKELAFGRFENYANGRITVTTANGQEKDIPYRDLSPDAASYVAAYWGVPAECVLPERAPRPRDWQMVTYTWKASALCHKPLYFQERALERYGHSSGPILQPVASGVSFVGHLFVLPYTVGMNPPWECMYSLGYYRPGDCAPYLVPPVPLHPRGAASAAVIYTGLPFLLP